MTNLKNETSFLKKSIMESIDSDELDEDYEKNDSGFHKE